MKNIRFGLALTAVLALSFAVGCAHKKVAKAAPAPAPPAAAPTATLAAHPTAVQTGQPVTLTWQTENANSVTIEGVGTVTSSGSRMVTPQTSTNYVLTAKGPGGEREASARVTVTQSPSQTASRDDDLRAQFARLISDVYFDYDRYSIRADQESAVKKAADFLLAHPGLKVTIEGHCDQRGSDEYNLALGDNRANALREALVKDGASASQFRTISYGKEHLFCTEDTEQCWAQNRRDHYVPNGATAAGQ
jgi:peptidoglycan-associated lipoprotein